MNISRTGGQHSLLLTQAMQGFMETPTTNDSCDGPLLRCVAFLQQRTRGDMARLAIKSSALHFAVTFSLAVKLDERL